MKLLQISAWIFLFIGQGHSLTCYTCDSYYKCTVLDLKTVYCDDTQYCYKLAYGEDDMRFGCKEKHLLQPCPDPEQIGVCKMCQKDLCNTLPPGFKFKAPVIISCAKCQDYNCKTKKKVDCLTPWQACVAYKEDERKVLECNDYDFCSQGHVSSSDCYTCSTHMCNEKLESLGDFEYAEDDQVLYGSSSSIHILIRFHTLLDILKIASFILLIMDIV